MANNRERALRWFENKGVNLNCTQCGRDTFEEGKVVALFAANAEDLEQGHAYKAYPLVCDNCGHMVLFHADKMGLDTEARE